MATSDEDEDEDISDQEAQYGMYLLTSLLFAQNYAVCTHSIWCLYPILFSLFLTNRRCDSELG